MVLKIALAGTGAIGAHTLLAGAERAIFSMGRVGIIGAIGLGVFHVGSVLFAFGKGMQLGGIFDVLVKDKEVEGEEEVEEIDEVEKKYPEKIVFLFDSKKKAEEFVESMIATCQASGKVLFATACMYASSPLPEVGGWDHGWTHVNGDNVVFTKGRDGHCSVSLPRPTKI